MSLDLLYLRTLLGERHCRGEPQSDPGVRGGARRGVLALISGYALTMSPTDFLFPQNPNPNRKAATDRTLVE